MMHRLLTAAIVTFAAAAPVAAHAAVELFFEGTPAVRPGTETVIVLKARLNEPVNALRTTVVFDPAEVTIAGTDDRESVIEYWLTPPGASTTGRLELEGIIPGGVGPGFTDTVVIARFTVAADGRGTATLTLEDSTVYRNQPVPTEASVSVRPFTFSVRADAPLISVLPGTGESSEDAAVRVFRDPSVNDGAWSVAFDVRGADGTIANVRIRERRFGLFGSWRDAINGARLSDQSRTSILEVAVPDGDAQRVVRSVVPNRLKVIWTLVAGVAAAAVLAFMRSRGRF